MSVRSIDQLELSVKALTLHAHDVLVIRVESNPTIAEMQNIQSGIANLMSGLDLGFSVSYIVLPRTLDMTQLNEDGMRENGWVRSFERLPQHA